jgi:hypothetical protein
MSRNDLGLLLVLAVVVSKGREVLWSVMSPPGFRRDETTKTTTTDDDVFSPNDSDLFLYFFSPIMTSDEFSLLRKEKSRMNDLH